MHQTEHKPTPLELRYRGSSPLRTLWGLYADDRPNLLRWAVLFLVRLTPGLITPLIFANIIDHLTGHYKTGEGSFVPILLNLGLLMALLGVNFPAHAFSSLYLSRAVRRMEVQVRRALIRRLQQLSMSVHDDLHSGRIQSKVLRDVDNLVMLSNQLAHAMGFGLYSFLVALGITLWREPRVTLLFVVMGPIAVYSAHLFRRRMRQRNREYRWEVEQMSSAFSEIIEMIPVTRAHAAEKAEVRRAGEHLETVRRSGVRVDLLNAIFVATIWTIMETSRYSCLLITGWMAWNGQISIGEVVLFQTLFTRLLHSLQQVLSMAPQISRGFEAIRSIGEILECPDLERNEGKRALPSVEGRFCFEHVGFTYPNTDLPALLDFRLEVRAGECIAFVGESGAGKSTLVSLLIGFHRPTAGRILLDGQDMAELDLRTYRRHIAAVPQETILFSGSVRENITYGLEDVSDETVREAVEVANLTDVIEALPDGLQTTIGESGGKLSGGQRQRLAIARAVIRDPRVILLDEATSALDVISEAQVQEAINRLIHGRTTFIVAHRLSTVRRADRIVVLKGGRMIETGTEAELLAQGGEYARLKSLQV